MLKQVFGKKAEENVNWESRCRLEVHSILHMTFGGAALPGQAKGGHNSLRVTQGIPLTVGTIRIHPCVQPAWPRFNLPLFILLNARQFQRRKRSQLAHCKERPEETLPLHQAPDAGAGKGVSVQHVPYSRAAPRDQPQRPPHGQTS